MGPGYLFMKQKGKTIIERHKSVMSYLPGICGMRVYVVCDCKMIYNLLQHRERADWSGKSYGMHLYQCTCTVFILYWVRVRVLGIQWSLS